MVKLCPNLKLIDKLVVTTKTFTVEHPFNKVFWQNYFLSILDAKSKLRIQIRYLIKHEHRNVFQGGSWRNIQPYISIHAEIQRRQCQRWRPKGWKWVSMLSISMLMKYIMFQLSLLHYTLINDSLRQTAVLNFCQFIFVECCIWFTIPITNPWLVGLSHIL